MRVAWCILAPGEDQAAACSGNFQMLWPSPSCLTGQETAQMGPQQELQRGTFQVGAGCKLRARIWRNRTFSGELQGRHALKQMASGAPGPARGTCGTACWRLIRRSLWSGLSPQRDEGYYIGVCATVPTNKMYLIAGYGVATCGANMVFSGRPARLTLLKPCDGCIRRH